MPITAFKGTVRQVSFLEGPVRSSPPPRHGFPPGPCPLTDPTEVPLAPPSVRRSRKGWQGAGETDVENEGWEFSLGFFFTSSGCSCPR